MKGVVLTGNSQLELREFEKPKPGKGQVVIRVIISAICGTDLHRYHRIPESNEVLYISGHEPCGIIEELGEGVLNLEVGQRVGIFHFHGCGACKWCASGVVNQCVQRAGMGSPDWNGADAEFLLWDAVNCIPLPDALSFEDGAFVACIGGTSYNVLVKLDVAGKDVCIYGLGPLGLTAVIFAKALGAKRVIGVDPNPERRKIAQELTGADYLLDADSDTVNKIIELTGGGVACTLETSGAAAAQRSAIASAAKMGKIGIVGTGTLYDADGVRLSTLIGKQLTVIGSWVMTRPQFYDMYDLMIEKNIHFDALITHRFPLSKAKEAFEVFSTGKTGKVVFDFRLKD